MLWPAALCAAPTVDILVDGTHPHGSVPAGFLGLSIEWPSVPAADGVPTQAHPLVLRYLRHLGATGHGMPNIRVGGASQDNTTAPHTREEWARLAHIAQEVHAPLIIGLNLARRDARLVISDVETAHAMLPPQSVQSFELGNEPDWYTGSHRRPPGYSHQAYYQEFQALAEALYRGPLRAVGWLSGPAWALPSSFAHLRNFADVQRRTLNLLTVHAYALNIGHPQTTYLDLLDDKSSRGLAAQLEGPLQAAHAVGLPLRISEINSMNGGGRGGISDSFAAVHWVLDTLFEILQRGSAGVNLHMSGVSAYSPLHVLPGPDGTVVRAQPLFYGMAMFALTTHGGGTLLPTRVQQTGAAHVKAWATRSPEGTTRVLLLAKDPAFAGPVAVRPSSQTSCARVHRLDAPYLQATGNLTLNGQGFSKQTAQLEGTEQVTCVHAAPDGALNVPISAKSIVMLEFDRCPPGC